MICSVSLVLLRKFRNMHRRFDIENLYGKEILFISPHHDDLVYSCGGTILLMLNNKSNVCNLNIFSLSKWSSNVEISIDEISTVRKKEEKEVSELWGFRSIDLDFCDSSYRGLNLFEELHTTVDTKLFVEISNAVSGVLQENKFDYAFLPMGIGNHIDHLYANRLKEIITVPIIFYEDLPYAVFHKEKHAYCYNECLVDVSLYASDKIAAMYCYRSQMEGKNHKAIIERGESFCKNKFCERVFWNYNK